MHLSDAKFLKTQTTTIMLLPDNIHPDNSIYYNGAFVIESLKRETKYSMLDLYQEVKSKRAMSFSSIAQVLQKELESNWNYS